MTRSHLGWFLLFVALASLFLVDLSSFGGGDDRMAKPLPVAARVTPTRALAAPSDAAPERVAVLEFVPAQPAAVEHAWRVAFIDGEGQALDARAVVLGDEAVATWGVGARDRVPCTAAHPEAPAARWFEGAHFGAGCNGRGLALPLRPEFATLSHEREAGDPHALTVTLERRATLEVLVVDAETGAPIQGAQVSVEGAAPSTSVFMALENGERAEPATDASGRIEVGLPAEDDLTVSARAEGYFSTMVLLDDHAPPTAMTLELRPMPVRDDWVVSGRVLDPTGRPIPGAGLKGADGNLRWTDANGAFTLEFPARRFESVTLVPLVGGHQPVPRTLDFKALAAERGLPPSARLLEGIDLHVTVSTHHLELTVLDEDGDPVRGLELWLLNGTPVPNHRTYLEAYAPALEPDGAWRRGLLAREIPKTDRDGRASLAAVGPPPYEVRLANVTRGWLVDRTLERDGAHVLHIVKPEREFVAGRVVDHCGEPVAGVEVQVNHTGPFSGNPWVTSSEGRTNGDGEFVVRTYLHADPGATVQVWQRDPSGTSSTGVGRLPLPEFLARGEVEVDFRVPLEVENPSQVQGVMRVFDGEGVARASYLEAGMGWISTEHEVPAPAKAFGMQVDRCAMRLELTTPSGEVLDYDLVRDGAGFARLVL